MRQSKHLIEIHTMLHESTQLVGRAVSNMNELGVSGLPSSTPGNGSPGGGKGASSRTMPVVVAGGWVDRVPVTSVEALAIGGARDEATLASDQLARAARFCATDAADVVERVLGQRPVMPAESASPMQLVVQAYRCAVVLVQLEGEEVSSSTVGRWYKPTRRVWELCSRWGFSPTMERSSADARELLAVDLTEMWCRSCLRVGERAPRDRGDLCRWCRTFHGVEGFLPPVDLVEAHADGRRITEAMIAPHRQAHQARVARKGRARR
jgi:hypothetical protein